MPADTKAQMGQSRTYSTTSASCSGRLSYHAQRAIPASRPNAAPTAPCPRRHGPARRQGATSRSHGNRDLTTRYATKAKPNTNRFGPRPTSSSKRKATSRTPTELAATIRRAMAVAVSRTATMPPATNMPSDVVNGRSVARHVSETATAGSPCMFALGPMPFSSPDEPVLAGRNINLPSRAPAAARCARRSGARSARTRPRRVVDQSEAGG